MLKRSAFKRILVASMALFILLILYFFPTKPTYKENLTYIEHEEIPIFLIDNLSYVGRTTIVKNSNNLNDQIKEIIESLIVDSNRSNYIKEGFNAIIPKNTKILNITLKDNILTINFSKELLNVKEEYEEKMIEALIYSLSELNEIKKIKILVEDTPLTNLPNSNKKLPEYLDKSYGINKLYNFDSIKNTTKTTIYYLSKYNNNYYYIPVTKITNDSHEKVEIIIKELKSTPIYNTNLISYLKASANISNYEILENSINLSFDNHLLANLDDNNMLEEVKYSIALSLRDTYNINEVIFNIPDTEKSIIKL